MANAEVGRYVASPFPLDAEVRKEVTSGTGFFGEDFVATARTVVADGGAGQEMCWTVRFVKARKRFGEGVDRGEPRFEEGLLIGIRPGPRKQARAIQTYDGIGPSKLAFINSPALWVEGDVSGGGVASDNFRNIPALCFGPLGKRGTDKAGCSGDDQLHDITGP